MSRRTLLRLGWSARRITTAVEAGDLLRLRRGLYASRGVAPEIIHAVRVGGRVTCVSELRLRGVWVPEDAHVHVHVHVPPHAGRSSPGAATVLHWSRILEPEEGSHGRVGILDALAVAADCLDPWWAIAAMESAVNRGDVSLSALQRGLGGRSERVRALVQQVRPDAQSGLETVVRLLATRLGFRVATQVRYPGIGVADLVVEGWIVVETDGSEFHDVATVAARDRRRDALHAAAGRTPLRFRYAQVVHDLPSVAAAIIGAVRAHRRVRNGGHLARRAEIRLQRLGSPPL